jgi:colanic acid/amylovoran biosynthesis glycosyltransferase
VTASSGLNLGYVVRRFPSLTQSFVLNEIRALERHGVGVRVFSVLPPKGADPMLVHASAPSDRTRELLLLDALGSRQLAVALAWILVRHPVRLFRTLMFAARKWRKIPTALLGKALLLSRAAGAIRISHLHAHLGLASDVAWLTHHMTGIGFSFTAHARDIYVSNHNLDRKLADASFVVTVCDSARESGCRQDPCDSEEGPPSMCCYSL